MPAHSWAAPGGVRIQFDREFSWTRAPSLNELREEGLDTVSMPNERTCREILIPQRDGHFSRYVLCLMRRDRRGPPDAHPGRVSLMEWAGTVTHSFDANSGRWQHGAETAASSH